MTGANATSPARRGPTAPSAGAPGDAPGAARPLPSGALASGALAGALVHLRALEPEDFEHVLELAGDLELLRAVGETRLGTSALAARRWCEERCAASVGTPEASVSTLVVETTEQVAVGLIEWRPTSLRQRVCSHALAIKGRYRRRGFGREALELLLGFAFDELGFYRAEAEIYAFNEASIALHRSLGFIEEGRRREAAFTAGRRHDILLFGLLARDFSARRT